MVGDSQRRAPRRHRPHLIDDRVDASYVVPRQTIDVFSDDTLFDLSERLFQTQLDMLTPVLQSVFAENPSSRDPLPRHGSTYHQRMTPDQEREAVDKFPAYIAKHAKVR